MRILLATDGSEPALRAAERLSALVPLERAEVRILTVLPFTLDPNADGSDQAEDGERRETERNAIEEATARPREILEATGASVKVARRFGFIAEQILEDIDEWKPDLVVLGRRGLSTAKRLLLGSISEQVAHGATVPVLLVS